MTDDTPRWRAIRDRLLAALLLAICATPAAAQDNYSRGYQHGYDNPDTATPTPSTEYGKGYRQGIEDRNWDDDEDDAAMLRSQRESEKQQEKQLQQLFGPRPTDLFRDPYAKPAGEDSSDENQ